MAALITTLKHRRSQTLAGSHHPRADIDETSHRRAGLLRPPRHLQRAHRSDQRPSRTPPRILPRIPQPPNYIARSLLETGGFKPNYTAIYEQPDFVGPEVTVAEFVGPDF
ncbi:putative transposase [Mycobacterium xenopi 3993]|nr:putative transposase [Mycobacterium xenopi 3993]